MDRRDIQDATPESHMSRNENAIEVKKGPWDGILAYLGTCPACALAARVAQYQWCPVCEALITRKKDEQK